MDYSGYRPWPQLDRPAAQVVLAVPCPVCPAAPGSWCDGTVICRWDGLHFARRAAAQKALAAA